MIDPQIGMQKKAENIHQTGCFRSISRVDIRQFKLKTLARCVENKFDWPPKFPNLNCMNPELIQEI